MTKKQYVKAAETTIISNLEKDYAAYPNSEEEIDEIIKATYKNVYDKVLL